jgi:DNA-binding GntR family transcriptional regulator
MNANPESGIRLYFQIEQDVASLIDGGTLAPGSQLPL